MKSFTCKQEDLQKIEWLSLSPNQGKMLMDLLENHKKNKDYMCGAYYYELIDLIEKIKELYGE